MKITKLNKMNVTLRDGVLHIQKINTKPEKRGTEFNFLKLNI